jgi:hypothetical protein
MKKWRIICSLIVSFSVSVSLAFAEDYQLQYFLGKVSSKHYDLSKKEMSELLIRIEGILEHALQVHGRLVQIIQGGETEIPYREGRFWMSKLEKDRELIESAAQQLKLLRERPAHLVASIELYKSMKDLSSDYNICNNMPSFAACVGDLAPEMELWADPVFYKLHLLPLAKSKDIEPKAAPRKASSKGKRS